MRYKIAGGTYFGRFSLWCQWLTLRVPAAGSPAEAVFDATGQAKVDSKELCVHVACVLQAHDRSCMADGGIQP